MSKRHRIGATLVLALFALAACEGSGDAGEPLDQPEGPVQTVPTGDDPTTMPEADSVEGEQTGTLVPDTSEAGGATTP